ncbi:MAG: hypothetical protein ACTHJW_14700, partial [Streptosporangiaceae bacterium]
GASAHPSLRLWRRRVIPYSSWLSSGDNAWQMTAATLVGLMSIPALAVLYGGMCNASGRSTP